MTSTPIDLDRMDAYYKATPSGTWAFSVSKSGRNQVHCNGQQVCMVWHTSQYPAVDVGVAISALHNFYPAIVAELRAARLEISRLQAVAAVKALEGKEA